MRQQLNTSIHSYDDSHHDSTVKVVDSKSKLSFHRPSIDSSYNNILNELITKCYQTLDREAEMVLNSEAFECINDIDLLVKILSRDTLRIQSELIVFDCLMRWAIRQCKIQHKELTCSNKRDLLGKAIYCPRYLVMTQEEFMRGPYISDVLTDEEKTALLDKLVGNNHIVLPFHLAGRKLDVQRQYVEPVDNGFVNNGFNESFGNGASRTVNVNSNENDNNEVVNAEKKKVSVKRKFINGIGDVAFFVIQLLD